MLRRHPRRLLALGLLMLAPAGAHAAAPDPTGFRLESAALTVHESAGAAVVTVQRADTLREAQVRYIALGIGVPCSEGPAATQCSAESPYDFTAVKGMLDFPAGVARQRFHVPIVDHGVFALAKTVRIALFGPSPIGLAKPSTAVLTIVNDDPPQPVTPGNPLGVAPAVAGPSNPLAGARFFVDHEDAAALAARTYPALRAIADQPGTARFGKLSGPDVGVAANHYLTRAAAQEPGTVPMLATMGILSGHCGHWSDPPDRQAAYHRFISRFAQGVGDYRAVLFLEMDSLITTPCLSAQGVAVRVAELRDAIAVLSANCPRLVVYLDAGAADAVPAKRIAYLLRAAGVERIQGFFLNSTHFDWTSKEIRFGETISTLTGGKHFVINTGESGRGPLVPRDRVRQGNERLCNPPGRGLGPRPTADTGFRNVDAFAWTSNPGESGGACVPGAPPAGAYWPAYALGLVRNAVYAVDAHARLGPAPRVTGAKR